MAETASDWAYKSPEQIAEARHGRKPTLDELLKRLRSDVKFKKQGYELYRRIAAGERHPTEPPLPGNVVILAAQAMVILFDHALLTKELPDPTDIDSVSETGGQ